jgi:hypothetical protein
MWAFNEAAQPVEQVHPGEAGADDDRVDGSRDGLVWPVGHGSPENARCLSSLDGCSS